MYDLSKSIQKVKICLGLKLKFGPTICWVNFVLAEKFPGLFALKSDQTDMLRQKLVRVSEIFSGAWTWRSP